ncbi:putative CAAX prenyl protease-related protein [Candidatus Sulfopaludibacter sp. SbA3]|nr:putative CAAX prenyl protease-related protein [Candidatus Sulfopaludibacter sp. SbA3]
MLVEWPRANRWWVRVLAGFVILSAEAWWARTTGIKGDIWSAGPILAGPNQFFRLFILPFLLTLLYVTAASLRAADNRHADPPAPLRKSILGHTLCFAAFALLTLLLTRRDGANQGSASLALLWFSVGVATAITGILAAFDPSIISRSNRGAALTVLAFAVASLVAMPLVERSWNYDSNVTVRAATALLRNLGFAVWSEGKRIRTPHFSVQITPACSGYEGICIFLIFAIAWLAWFRREYRFPAALLVLPIGAAISWSLNVVRISAYVLIGYFGHPDVAMNGFHSWAGLISFTVLTLGFCAYSPHIPVISKVPDRPKSIVEAPASDPMLYYAGPFVAMLAASMISRAASGSFEWFYPIRVLAAAAAIWCYRKEYRAMQWNRTHSLFAAGVGCAVAALWLVSSLRFPSPPAPWTHLLQASPIWRITWLCFRVCGGVLVTPFAEELAFRGFLMRRVQASEFASTDPRQAGWQAIAVSSLVFGLMHGTRIAEGMAAGALYGYTYKRTGKLGDAFLAHAVTNLLLVIVVAGTGDPRYW